MIDLEERSNPQKVVAVVSKEFMLKKKVVPSFRNIHLVKVIQ